MTGVEIWGNWISERVGGSLLEWIAMIDVGLVGFGLAGRSFHAPVIRAVEGLRLAAIVQRTGNEAAEKYPDVRLVKSLAELLAMREIRLVVIATPNETHAPFARECLAAGRDVLADKPFATSFAEAAELVKLARDAGRILTVYQSRRYDGDFQVVRELVKAGTLGRIVRFETSYDRFRPKLRGAWRERVAPGSGILFDLGPHLIDHAMLLFGVPEAVTADVRKERDGAVVDDAFDVMLHYANGMRAALRATMLGAAPRARFVVQGTGGAFFKQKFDPQEENLRRGYVPVDSAWGAEPEEDWGVLTVAEGDTVSSRKIPSVNCDYRDFYANLRDALLGKAELAVSIDSALNVMRVLEMARASSEERRTISW